MALARDELSPQEASPVRRHVALCASCAMETRWVVDDAAQPTGRAVSARRLGTRARSWPWLLAAAAALATVALLIPGRGPADTTRIRRASFLAPPERAVGPQANLINTEGDRLLLILELDLPPADFPVELEIVGADGRSILRQSGIGPEAILQGTYLFVDCTRSDCAPGAYTAKVRGSAGQEMSFRFEVGGRADGS